MARSALALVICCAALSALNGTIFTGARLYRAVGNDLPVLQRLGLGRVARRQPDASPSPRRARSRCR